MTQHRCKNSLLGISILLIAIGLTGPKAWPQEVQAASSEGAPLELKANLPAAASEKPGKRVYTSMDYLDPRPLKGSKFGVSYFQLATAPMDNVQEGDARISTYNYVSLAYLLPHHQALMMKPVFFFNTAGKDRDRSAPAEVSTGDWYVEAAQGGLRVIEDWRLRASLRLYAPLSQASKAAGQIAQIQPYLVFERRFSNRWTLDYYFKPSYFAQSQAAFIGDSGFAKGTKAYEFEHFAELEWHWFRWMGVAQQVGTLQTWFNASPANEVRGFRNQYLTLESGFFFEPDRGLFIRAVASNRRAFEKLEEDPDLYRSAETQYLVMTSVLF